MAQMQGGPCEISFPRLGWKLREANSSHQLSRTDDLPEEVEARNYYARHESQAN